jgi:predicted GNAT family N-acyltransferase
VSITQRKTNDKLTEIQKLIHDRIVPADIHFGDPIYVSIALAETPNHDTKWHDFRGWRVSPMGVEVVSTQKSEMLKFGDKVQLRIRMGDHETYNSGVVVTTEQEEQGNKILGVRLTHEDEEVWTGKDRRSKRRWDTVNDFVPTGMFLNPGRFNDFIYYRINNLSRTGAQIHTSLRNNFLMLGLTVKSTVSFPLIGSSEISFKTENIKVATDKSGKEVLQVGVSFVNPNPHFLSQVAQYLLQFGSANSVKEVRNTGLVPPHTSSAIDFRYVRTEAEYQKVLDLRRLAYGAAGKITENSEVADIYDSRSRIIIGAYRGHIVASCRLIYNDIEEVMEHENFVKFENGFPRRDEICEITRVCTHPEFRGSDILLALFRFAAKTVIHSGRKYVVGSATKDLLPIYTRLGFRTTKYTYEHKALNNAPHVVFVANIHKIAAGSGVSPIIWNLVWLDLILYAKDYGLLQLDPVTNLRIGIYRLFRPFALLAKYFMTRPRKKAST